MDAILTNGVPDEGGANKGCGSERTEVKRNRRHPPS